MEVARISSQETFRAYLNSLRLQTPLSSAEINQIVESAIFDEIGFRDCYAKSLNSKLSTGERNELFAALGMNIYDGRPTIVVDHYPGPGGLCAPKDNYWCAQY